MSGAFNASLFNTFLFNTGETPVVIPVADRDISLIMGSAMESDRRDISLTMGAAMQSDTREMALSLGGARAVAIVMLDT